MSDFWLSVVSGTVSGVITAALWAVILFSCSKWNDRWIEKSITRQFFPRTLSHNTAGWGMQIENKTGSEVTIREFSLVGVPRDGNGTATIRMGLAAAHSDKVVTTTGDGWVIMPPFTKATLVAPPADHIREW